MYVPPAATLKTVGGIGLLHLSNLDPIRIKQFDYDVVEWPARIKKG
jgi:hypothetical protein